MDALSEAIVRVLRRLDSIEARLSVVERALNLETVTAPPAAPAPAAPVEPPPAAVPAAPPHEPETRRLETRLGLTWINRVGVVTMILAAAFFFKYAVDNRWIGEAGRVILGVLAGFLSLGLAERTSRSGHRIYSQGLCGLGVAVLYLSFYASFGFYKLVPQALAFFLMTLTTALAGGLALRYDAAAILVLGLLGGYATPPLLSTGEDRPWFLFGYVLLLNLGALWASGRRNWRRIEILALAGTAILYVAWYAGHFQRGKEFPATFWPLAFYALFAVSRSMFSPYASQVLTIVALLAVWEGRAAWPPLALAVSAAGLAIASWRNRPLLAATSLSAFWLLAFAWYGGLPVPRPGGAVLLWLTAALLLFLAWIPWRVLRQRTAATAPELALVVMNGLAYYSICHHLLWPDYQAYLGMFTVALGALHLGTGYVLWSRQPADRRDLRPVLLCAGLALVFLTLAAPVQFTGYRITIAWSLEAAALVWIARGTGSASLKYAAFVVFALALIRLAFLDAFLLPDAAAYAAIGNLRFLTFAVSALSFWGASRWLAENREKLAAYVAGHAVLLWALILEAAGWADRTAAAENVVSLRSAAISILLMSYALLLVGLGVAARSGVSRVLGLGLVGVVVLKLYLYDVWQLRRVYRVIAFTVLGALLLLTSFLYSRYRDKIENWWKHEKAGP
jgi:uncharacterized membrane protein